MQRDANFGSEDVSCDDVSHDDTAGYRSGVGTPV